VARWAAAAHVRAECPAAHAFEFVEVDSAGRANANGVLTARRAWAFALNGAERASHELAEFEVHRLRATHLRVKQKAPEISQVSTEVVPDISIAFVLLEVSEVVRNIDSAAFPDEAARQIMNQSERRNQLFHGVDDAVDVSLEAFTINSSLREDLRSFRGAPRVLGRFIRGELRRVFAHRIQGGDVDAGDPTDLIQVELALVGIFGANQPTKRSTETVLVERIELRIGTVVPRKNVLQIVHAGLNVESHVP
jgi:hypothetical protein